MSRPISLELPPLDPPRELNSQLQQAPLEHADAVLAWYVLLQELRNQQFSPVGKRSCFIAGRAQGEQL